MAPEGAIDQALSAAVEGLYGDERLRSALTDDEATALLGWAQAQLEEAARAPAGRGEEEAALERFQERTRQVRRAVRDANDLVGEKDGLSDEDFTGRLQTALAGADAAPAPLPTEAMYLVSRRRALDNRQVIDKLTDLFAASWKPAGEVAVRRQARAAEPQPGTVRRAGGTRTRRSTGSGGGGGLGMGPILLLGAIVVVAIAVAAFLYLSSRPSTAPAPSPPAGTGGWYQLYFTSPRYPDNAADHRGSLDEKLTAFINTATRSVDMAIYQLDLENVTRALLDAKTRGATVRVVTDVDETLEDPKENPSFKRLQAAEITVVAGNPNSIMHDKFVVVDQQAVWTGSWNFTVNDTYRYNNNGLLIQSPELARNYTATFEKMWRDKKFSASRKSGGTTQKLTIGGVTVESYFAPEDGVAEKIVNRIKEAQKSIDFMAFSFTDDQIGATVLGRSSAGVKVRGVFERTGSETQYSEFTRMKSAKLDVLQDGNPYLMHHKVFVVDGKTVITGSFNFSQSAEDSNDENLLIVDEEAMAGAFTAEFERVYAQARNAPAK